MKVSNKMRAGYTFLTTIIGVFFLVGQALAAAPQANGEMSAWEHCGCDNQKEIENYVQNLINDAKGRGMSCGTAQIHTQACISVYCSICEGHPGMVESCVQTASAYFLNSPGFCLQQPGNRPEAFFTNFIF